MHVNEFYILVKWFINQKQDDIYRDLFIHKYILYLHIKVHIHTCTHTHTGTYIDTYMGMLQGLALPDCHRH